MVNDKWQIVVVHDKADRVTASTAAKAIVELFVWVDAKRGRFLVVEGTASWVIFTGFFEFDALIDDFDDVGAV